MTARFAGDARGASPNHDPLVLSLGDEPDSVGRARRWINDRLGAAQLDHVAGEAALVASELATNALLHGQPPAALTVAWTPKRVRVEVRDGSPVPPVRSQRGREGMTGRGLHVIEGLAADWGVEPLADGKVVWAELPTDPAGDEAPESAEDPEELLARWATEEPAGEAAEAAARLYTVRLGDVPTDLLLSAKAHVEGLVREFELAASGARTGATPEVPPELADLLSTVVDRFAEPRQAIKRQALSAADAGEDHVSLALELPLSAADSGEEYLRALDQADAYCRAARLLTLESPPRHRIFRHWYVEELITQLRAAARGVPYEERRASQTFQQRLLAEIDAVAAAERAAERTARMSSLAVALSSAVTLEAVGHAVLTEGVAALGARDGRLLLDPRSPLTLHIDGASGVTQLTDDPSAPEQPAAAVLRTGDPVWLESPHERDERFPDVAFEPDATALCVLPLALGDRRLGALRFTFAQPRLFDDEERAFALAVAAQTAQALDRALLYHQRLDASRQLQRSLLPPALPTVEGVDLATHYDTAEPLSIGGDFYDLVSAGGEWTLLIGDVRGKGVDAATLTSLARHTVRAGALRHLEPTEILRLLNDALLEQASPESFCTGICGRLTLEPGSATLSLSGGGHPPPLVLRADGTVDEVACGGMLIGAFPDAEFSTTTVTLRPGDLAFLYTDGVTEARRDGQLFGTAGVARTLREAAGMRADWVVKHVHQAVEAFQVGQRDDTAMLAVRLLAEEETAAVPESAAVPAD